MKPVLVINRTKMNELYNNKYHEEILKCLMLEINVCKNVSNFYPIFIKSLFAGIRMGINVPYHNL